LSSLSPLKMTWARSPCIPCGARTGVPRLVPRGLESVLKRRLNSENGAAGLGRDVVRVAAVADGGHPAVLADFLQIAPSACSHHPAA